ncbi:MAG: hypothetical protein NTX63_02940 [Candidatus Peregrinibacteria bacterium]|nr:hypothetical protein [Candidatus Peregrinibacteria bacterium]
MTSATPVLHDDTLLDGIHSVTFASDIKMPDGFEWTGFLRSEAYSPGTVARTITEALSRDNSRLLKSSIYRASGVEDAQVVKVDFSAITYGIHNVIIKIDCEVQMPGGNKNVPLVAIVSRCREADCPTRDDAEKITLIRQRESALLRLSEKSREYDAKSTFSPVYGTFKGEHGPQIALTKYQENSGGLYVSATYKGRSDELGKEVDRVNSVATIDCNVEVPNSVILSIIQHQLVTAAKCHVVLAPSLEAGDYIVNFKTGRYMLTTTRNNNYMQNDYWALAAEEINEKDGDITSLMVAYQLLQITTAFSENADNEDEKNRPTRHPFFAYNMEELGWMIQELMNMKGFLDPQQWGNIVRFVDMTKGRMHKEIADHSKDPSDVLRAAEYKRVVILQTMISFFLAGRRLR